MMRTLPGPRAGSRAYAAMQTLCALGGSASAATWMKAGLWKTTVFDFDRTVIAPLTLDKHIHERNDLHILTDGGMVHIGEMEPPVAPVGVVAGPRCAPPIRPLSSQHLVRVRSMRVGSFDYRNVPSRHGDQLVAFKSGLNVLGEDAQG
jgi:hypothetical protein